MRQPNLILRKINKNKKLTRRLSVSYGMSFFRVPEVRLYRGTRGADMEGSDEPC